MQPGQHSFSTANPTHGLAHLSFHCPGLHGAGACQQDVRRQTFEELLSIGKPVLRIPPFQRAYCWDEKLAQGWWRDCRSGSHSTGKAIFCPFIGVDPASELMVIDGQQRLTTTSLLLAAIRDAALNLAQVGDERYAGVSEKVATACDETLCTDVHALGAYLEDARLKVCGGVTDWDSLLPADDAELPFLSLVPTLRDRSCFMQVLLARRLGLAVDATGPMRVVKCCFDNLVKGRNAHQLAADLQSALRGMHVMVVTILRPPAGIPQQVYQWAQERALASSIEVHNPTPGVWLTVSDLLRNIVLAPLLDLDARHMERLLRQLWLPFEERFQSPAAFDAFLLKFVGAWPCATISDTVAPIMQAAQGAEALLGVCELSAKLKLYGGVVAEYDAVASDLSDKTAVIQRFVSKLQAFFLTGVKTTTTVDTAHSLIGNENSKRNGAPSQMMPPPPGLGKLRKVSLREQSSARVGIRMNEDIVME